MTREHVLRPASWTAAVFNLVAFGAIGKAAAFFVVVLLWLRGAARATSVLGIVGDLVLAAVFLWRLRDRRRMSL
jgi:hypothetical protein